MAKAVGIDLGTTNSVIAVMEGGRPTVIQNAEGSRITPSVVGFTKDGQRLVGQVARRQSIINPENTVFSIKRFMGRKYAEVAEEMKIVPYKVVAGPNDAVRVEIMGKLYAPEEISAMILRKMVDDASRYVGETIKDVIITVPAYFNDAQRQATKDAGNIAGLNVLRIINEPTAASLAYGMDKKKNETILVFDLGGGTFDVSILDVGEGVFEVKSTNGDTHLGGDNFDKRVVDYIADEFKRDAGIDLRKDRQALQRLYEASEKAKCELSTVLETEINLPFITADASGPKHLQIKVTRAKLEEITEDLVQRCLGPMKQAMQDAKLTGKDIDEVVLVGGSTRMPAVQKLVRDFIGKDPCLGVNPDEVVAVGAAIQSGVLAGEVKDILLLDVTPLSLGVETMGGVMTRLIERNTTIPCRRAEIFSTAEDSQTAVDIHVLQGERELSRDNRLLGHFRLEGIRPAPRGIPRVEVTFDIDANGILSVKAQDKDTNKEQSITISGSTNLDKGEIDRMVHDGETHREEDHRRREEIEIRNKADQLAYQLEREIKNLGEKAPAAEKAQCERLIEDIRKAVKENANKDKLEPLINELNEAFRKLTESAYKATAAGAGKPGAGPSASPEGPGGEPGGPAAGGKDDVIDADFKETN